MDNTREKLSKLLGEAHRKSTEEACFNDATYAKQLRVEADHLIANGVTIREHDCHWATEQAYKNGFEAGKPKWIPVTERLPEHGDVVLIYTKHKDIQVFQWDAVYDGWVGDRYNYSKKVVTHWMPLPEPPKGE